MEEDIWSDLRKSTNARIGLGRAGTSLRTAALLDFKKGHALARDAVHFPLDEHLLTLELGKMNLPFCVVHSLAKDRITYLQRPDLGRSLLQLSKEEIISLKHVDSDLCVILADGLSSQAIHKHAIPFLKVFLKKINKTVSLNSVFVAKQSRVALGDEIGQLANAKIAVMLIGERPGLSTSDSMGIYMTYEPRPGLTDESRNCISNIHGRGLSYELAADKLLFLTRASLFRKLSGVNLKENSTHLQP